MTVSAEDVEYIPSTWESFMENVERRSLEKYGKALDFIEIVSREASELAMSLSSKLGERHPFDTRRIARNYFFQLMYKYLGVEFDNRYSTLFNFREFTELVQDCRLLGRMFVIVDELGNWELCILQQDDRLENNHSGAIPGVGFQISRIIKDENSGIRVLDHSSELFIVADEESREAGVLMEIGPNFIDSIFSALYIQQSGGYNYEEKPCVVLLPDIE